MLINQIKSFYSITWAIFSMINEMMGTIDTFYIQIYLVEYLFPTFLGKNQKQTQALLF